ncbi:hypothetical protein N8588_01140 [Akkermansiaceae bacterium]|nr:hypothetical protein [Akkermansiaceae bacterium]MDA7609857.1 hypothetical protein [bacterium]MDA7617023.1 hypothetical protein [Akkermansiaceae bacterium]MDA7624091.1 hypothetical protein [Akkermansiaceae bacterium]MDA7635913.1 hypothetical protein [Akkermansiaceae bacterium]
MEDPVDQQRLNEYQSKVSDWIGRQGVLFQFRYARTVGAVTLGRHLSGLTLKLVLFLVVAGVCGFFVLNRHFDSPGYGEKVAGQVANALGAGEIEVTGFSRNFGKGDFQFLELKGGEESFFYEAKFEKLRGEFSFLTGVTDSWRPSAISIKKADLRLKAGGSEDEMKLGFSSIIESLKGQGISQIKIEDCSFSWGYSKLTFGMVRNSDFRAVLHEGIWEVELSGGTFQQNWLGPLAIKSADLKIGVGGIKIESLNLESNGGEADLKGSISGPVNMPTFDLAGGFNSLPIEKLIKINGVSTREYIEGRISGDLKIGGSSNRQVELSGQVKLDENDSVTIRERWSLLRALSILDNERTYLRIDFNQGGFAFSTGGGGMQVSEINLNAGNKARLLGSFKTRLPTQAEAAETLGIKLTNNFSLDYTDSSAAQELENDRMRIDSRDDELGFGVDIERTIEDGELEVPKAQLSVKELEALRMRQEMEVHRILGDLKLAVPASSFNSSKALLEIYPKDELGWRWIPIELNDANFMNLSDKANELLLKQARLRVSGPVKED